MQMMHVGMQFIYISGFSGPNGVWSDLVFLEFA